MERMSCRNNDSSRFSEVRSVLDIYNNDTETLTEAVCTHSEIEAPRHTSECLEAANNNTDGQKCCSECTPLLNN